MYIAYFLNLKSQLGFVHANIWTLMCCMQSQLRTQIWPLELGLDNGPATSWLCDLEEVSLLQSVDGNSMYLVKLWWWNGTMHVRRLAECLGNHNTRGSWLLFLREITMGKSTALQPDVFSMLYCTHLPVLFFLEQLTWIFLTILSPASERVQWTLWI